MALIFYIFFSYLYEVLLYCSMIVACPNLTLPYSFPSMMGTYCSSLKCFLLFFCSMSETSMVSANIKLHVKGLSEINVCFEESCFCNSYRLVEWFKTTFVKLR